MATIDDQGTIHLGPTPLLTAPQLASIAPRCAEPGVWAPLLDSAMRSAAIATLRQRAMFLANCLHESDAMRFQREVWGPTATQRLYERNFNAPWPPTPLDSRNAKAWQLGNVAQGDGFLLRGAGLMQCTGRKNLLGASLRLYGDDRLVSHPEMLDNRNTGVDLATDFWRVQAGRNLDGYAHRLGAVDGCDLNDYAEIGSVELVRACINGGANGLEAVRDYYAAALSALAG